MLPITIKIVVGEDAADFGLHLTGIDNQASKQAIFSNGRKGERERGLFGNWKREWKGDDKEEEVKRGEREWKMGRERECCIQKRRRGAEDSPVCKQHWIPKSSVWWFSCRVSGLMSLNFSTVNKVATNKELKSWWDCHNLIWSYMNKSQQTELLPQ